MFSFLPGKHLWLKLLSCGCFETMLLTLLLWETAPAVTPLNPPPFAQRPYYRVLYVSQPMIQHRRGSRERPRHEMWDSCNGWVWPEYSWPHFLFGIIQQFKTQSILPFFPLSFVGVRAALWFEGCPFPPSTGPTPLLFTGEQITPQTNFFTSLNPVIASAF